MKRYESKRESKREEEMGQGRWVTLGLRYSSLSLPSQEFISFQPLRILGVKVHPGQNKEQILLDLNLR